MRITEGTVPRQRVGMGEGPRMMARKVVGREARGVDCWMRVLRRSAGCSRKAARAPEESPEAKW